MSLEELANLEKELRAHEGYLKRQWLSPEGYKNWSKRKQSLVGKIRRRKIKAGLLMNEIQFQEIFDQCNEKGQLWYTLQQSESYHNIYTPNQKSRMVDLVLAQHCR